MFKLPTFVALTLISCAIESTFAAKGPFPNVRFTKGMERILNAKHRPTVTDVIELVNSCPFCFEAEIERRYKAFNMPIPASQVANICAHVEAELPAAIVKLEYFYPHGLYATLGRDSYFIADLLEAFYLSRGYTDRVVRIEMSGPTVEFNNQPGRLLQILESNGLDLTAARTGLRPFALIDRTGYRTSSQSFRILSDVFRSPQLTPWQRGSLARYAGVISSTSGVKDLILSAVDLLTFRDMSAFELEAGRIAAPRPIQISELSFFTDKDELSWTGPFGTELEKIGAGRLVGKASVIDTPENRLTTLYTFWQIYQLVQAPKFTDNLISEGDRLKFNITRHLEVYRDWTNSLNYTESLKNALRTDLFDQFQNLDKFNVEHLEEIESLLMSRIDKLFRRPKSAGTLFEILGFWQSHAEVFRKLNPATTAFGIYLREILANELLWRQSSSDSAATPLAYVIEQSLNIWNLPILRTGAEVAEMAEILVTTARVHNRLIPQDVDRLIGKALDTFYPKDAADLISFYEGVKDKPALVKYLQDKLPFFLSRRRDRKRAHLNFILQPFIEHGVIQPSPKCAARLGAT